MDNDGYYNGSYYHDGMMNGGGWTTAFAVISIVLLLVAVVAVLANLFLHLSSRGSALSPDKPASDVRPILDNRLARGDISAEEYNSLRSLIDG